MTLEQAIKRIQDKESQIRQLKIEIDQTKRELKNLTPITVGEKVSVVNHMGESIVCFVSDVEWKGYGDEKWEYKFTKPKKDGTMGMQSCGIYYYKSVTKH